MNSGDDNNDFERELLAMELRRPPAEWKALMLPVPVVPWFPKPFLIGLGICWSAVAGLLLTTPEPEIFSPPLISPPVIYENDLLGFNSTTDSFQ